jgi:hypothetical protein
MVRTGWMHIFLRMYWAKRILEWSPSLSAAYQQAIQLNDRRTGGNSIRRVRFHTQNGEQ